MRIFRKSADYQAFLECLDEGLMRYKVDLLAWCVMPNHWHLVLRPRADRQLQEFMRWITVTRVSAAIMVTRCICRLLVSCYQQHRAYLFLL